MRSKKHVRNISISDEAHDRVLFEGNLGRLMEVSVIEGGSLEVIGANGVLRLEIGEDILRRVLTSPGRELSLSSEVGSYTSTKKQEERKPSE
jgi:hypothetical protein